MGGRLRCVLTPVDHTKVRALFHANWLCFSGDYEVELLRRNASKSASGRLTGTHDLPAIFGGTYRYDAEIAGLRFTARYSSKYDAGVFDMTQQLTKRESIH